jgi:hypothetical protein
MGWGNLLSVPDLECISFVSLFRLVADDLNSHRMTDETSPYHLGMLRNQIHNFRHQVATVPKP